MHYFTSHRPPRTRRYFLHFDTPVNPLCWIRGHRPIGRVHDFKSAGTLTKVVCRVCDREYPVDLSASLSHLTPAEQRERAKDIETHRAANARRDPIGFGRGQAESVRDGWRGRRVELALELVRNPHGGPAFRFHLGNAHSETPIDGHISTGRHAAFWSIGGIGGRTAALLGRGHKRDLALRLDNEGGWRLWWKGWYDDDGGYDAHHRCDKWRTPRLWPWSAGRNKYRSWMCLRDGTLDLNPATAFWGGPRRQVEELAAADIMVHIGQYPGDSHLVTAKLQRVTWAREHGPAWARRTQKVDLTVAWEGRIPFRNDSWKGNDVLASGITFLSPPHPDWPTAAAELIRESMRASRERHGFVPPAVVP